MPGDLVRSVNHIGAAAQNALEFARFGGLDTGEEPAPSTLVHSDSVYRLHRYFPDRPDAAAPGPPIVLVPPMMLAADVFDVSPSSSAVTVLAERGADPWVVDFGSPGREAGGLDRTLTDHIVAISDAVDRVRKLTDRDVHLAGYSQGGMFCYQTAAYRRSDGIASLITFGSPVDTHGLIPPGVSNDLAARALTFFADNLISSRGLPAWASKIGFRLLDPVKSVRQRVEFLRNLYDRDALLRHEGQRRFIRQEGWVAWPGPALAELLKHIVAQNRMIAGGFEVEDRMVTLADLTCPILCFVGSSDDIAPGRVVRAIEQAAPQADAYEIVLRAGHFGLVVGTTAMARTWPEVARWAQWCDGDAEMPDDLTRLSEANAHPATAASDWEQLAADAGKTLELVQRVSMSAARSTARGASRSGRMAMSLTREALEQFPMVSRLERVRPSTRVSMGLLLDEQARSSEDDVAFLYEDRGHSYGAAKYRIDSVVRGLISLGIRQGSHVGILMKTRPSALTAVAALNRIGAVAVMLRPEGATRHELELGQCSHVITDPEHAPTARRVASLPVLVLGGGGRPRELGEGVVDMERIDPDNVDLPAWYAPNPGRGRDLAFILFAGQGDRARVNRITNGRWALSAFGTASSAGLSSADTVYGITPLYHPAGILTAIGGALAGGARLAMTTEFEPETFWQEVRRYGVTVVSYTWTLVRDLVNAPEDARERHHPIRMFVGSGMPVGLWRRVVDRLGVQVVEFYASTEGDAILANVAGEKIGSMGRPIPGSAQVRIAAYDSDSGRLVEGADGFAIGSEVGEVGMLLAGTRADEGSGGSSPLRGVFSRNDAWLATDDLFFRDDAGDFWLVDHDSLGIRTARGTAHSVTVENALYRLDAVDLAIAYGVSRAGAEQLLVAAVTLREEMHLDSAALTRTLGRLAPENRPDVVRVVKRIPTTAWFRLQKSPLRHQGIPRVRKKTRAFYRDDETGGYRPLDHDARMRLVGDPGAVVESETR